MSNFEEVLKTDAAGHFQTEGFHESIVYTPRGAAPRTIRAEVIRRSPNDVVTGRPAPSLEVVLPNSSSPIVGVASIDKDGDTVTVAERQGGTPKAHYIAEILSQDAGAWHLRLR